MPASWKPEGPDIVDSELYLLLSVRPVAAAELAAQFEIWRGEERGRAIERGFVEAVAAPDTLLALPADWMSAELIATVDEELGAEQRYRVVLFAHAFDRDRALVGALYAPEVLTRDAERRFAAILTSARLAR